MSIKTFCGGCGSTLKPKAEGAVDTCPACGIEVICHLKKTEGFADKLQWQNKNGTAHYNFDFKTKAISCNKPEPSDMPMNDDEAQEILEQYEADNQKTRSIPIEEQKKIDINHKIIKDQIELLDNIEDVVHRHMPNESPQHIGMYVKEIYRYMTGGL